MKKPKFKSYLRPNGHNEFIEYFTALPVKERVKLQATIEITEEKGLQLASRLQLIKKIDDNLFELRSRQGNNYQRGLYFHVTDNYYIITQGFSKKTNKTPSKEIQHAISLRKEFYQQYKESQP